jgi:hypothetical protein
VLAVCPDDILDEVSRSAEDLGFALPATPYSEFSDASLKGHWRAIHDLFAPGFPYLDHEPKLTQRLDLAPTSLPTKWLERQVRHSLDDVDQTDQVSLILKAQSLQSMLSAGVSSGSADQGRGVSPFFPVTLSLPGIASGYSRRAYPTSTRARIEALSPTDEQDTWSVDIHSPSDAMVERSAIELLAAHRAIAQTGVGLMLPSVPTEAFTALAAIERHFIDGPNGPSTSLLLDRLNTASRSVWTEAAIKAIAGASSLTLFSNFPLGLPTMPGDSSPLSTRVPISYRPLNPLSQAMQREVTYSPAVNLSRGFKIMIAECIPTSDPVGVVSRLAWEGAKEFFNNGSYPITFDAG